MTSGSTSQRLGDIGKLPSRLLLPIEGYEKVPLVSLEEAVKPLVSIVPKVERNVKYVKECCPDPVDGLTKEESAAIMLYTLESIDHDDSLYVKLNQSLRSEIRKDLTPWFLYLRLIITALNRLPEERRTVCRGIRGSLWTDYPKGKTFVWWGFSSCTSSVEVLENQMFFGKDGDRTLFQIDCTTAKDIRKHSLVPIEDEVLLLPARKFLVKSCLDAGHGLHIVQLEEIKPDYDLLEPLPMSDSIPETSLATMPKSLVGSIPLTSQWKQEGITVAGGNGASAKCNDNQLFWPKSVCVINDGDQKSIIVADSADNRIVRWDLNGSKVGTIVAGRNTSGGTLKDLNEPTHVMYDRKTNSLIIADSRNQRVVQWPYNCGATEGVVLIENIGCQSLFLDVHRYLYVSDIHTQSVRRYLLDQVKTDKGTIVAGGNGKGSQLNQFDDPWSIFVDENQTIYVSDSRNHRVMKWDKGAKQGVIVAGRGGSGSELTQLLWPQGIFVDDSGVIYLADCGNHRILRCVAGVEHATVILGGQQQGKGVNQFSYPFGLAIDHDRNIFVTDKDNHRVQMFSYLQK